MKIVKSAVAAIATGMLFAGTVAAQQSTPSAPTTPPTGDIKQKQEQGTAPATPGQRTAPDAAKDRMGKDKMDKPGMSDTRMSDKPDRDKMGGAGDSMAGTEQVRQAQQALKDKGQYEGTVDGVMGAKTKAAVKSYQQAEGLKVTGRLDAQTMAKLGVSDTSSPSAAPKPPSSMDTDKQKRGGDTQTTPPAGRKQNP